MSGIRFGIPGLKSGNTWFKIRKMPSLKSENTWFEIRKMRSLKSGKRLV